MPRDSNGTYTLPSGNPVVTGTVIAAGWANPTMGDLANELTNSLDRQGRGGMLAPFKFLDGTAGGPGMTWTNEPTTGFFRAGASDMQATVAGVPRMRWTGAGVDVWDTANSNWLPLTTGSGSNFALLNTANVFSSNQTLQNTNGDMAWMIKNKPFTKGALFGFSINTADALELTLYNGAAWIQKFTATPTISYYDNDVHNWRTAGSVTPIFAMSEPYSGVIRNAAGFASMRITTNTSSISATDGESLDFYEGVTPVGFIRCYRDGASTMRLMNAQDGWTYFGGGGVDVMRYRQSQGLEMLAGRNLTFQNAATTDTMTIGMSSLNNLSVIGRGGLMHWLDSTMGVGYISRDTVIPAATGVAGHMVLVYE